MKKKCPHIDLPPDVQDFRDRFIAATEVEGTLGGIITCYKVHGRYFARTKSSLTGKRVKKDKCFQRTMHNAGILALATQYVTPIYNELTDDWRCQDLYHKLVGIGVRLLHQGYTKEMVQQAIYAALEDLGYKTAWPVWQLPPNLREWLEEEEQENMAGNKGECVHTQAVWIVNEQGKLLLATTTADNCSPAIATFSSITDGFIFHDSAVAEPP